MNKESRALQWWHIWENQINLALMDYAKANENNDMSIASGQWKKCIQTIFKAIKAAKEL